MKKIAVLFVFYLIACLSPLTAQQESPAPPTKKYLPLATYDPSRNAEQDIQDALGEARRARKHVLLEVGGEWCGWCHTLDKFFEQHPDLLAYREKNFVMVKVNFSKENRNEKVLSRFPRIPGYPHLFVLETDGKLLHSQNTSELEEGTSYNLKKFFAFLRSCAPSS